jgi:hypothetical protein
MAEPFANLFRSKFINFQVGPEGTNFTIHAQPLARLSRVLNALINGDMVEAKTGMIDWRDIDEETFLRFCEFAYVQDYTPPRFGECTGNREEPELEPPKLEQQQAEMDSWDKWGSLAKKKKKDKLYNGWEASDDDTRKDDSAKSRLRNTLSDSDYLPPSSKLSFHRQFETISNTSPHQDFAPVFLGHARLYVLADKYDVRELKSLVLYKLYNTLKAFTLYKSRIADVIELVQFVYDNTPPSYQCACEAGAISQSEANPDRPVNASGYHEERKMDGLRKLVTSLVVSKLEMVAETRVFLDLLQDGGEFVKDFWTVLWNRQLIQSC